MKETDTCSEISRTNFCAIIGMMHAYGGQEKKKKLLIAWDNCGRLPGEGD